MPFADFAPRSPGRKPSWMPILLVVLAVVTLHVLLGAWMSLQSPTLPTPSSPPVEVHLIPLRPVAPPAKVKPHVSLPAARPAPQLRPHPTPALHLATPPAAPPILATDNPAAPPEATGDGATGAANSSSSVNGTSDASTAPPAQPPADAAPFDPPPSANLEYDLLMNNVRNETSVIHWQNDGTHYSLRVNMPVIFLGSFTYTSEGGFDAYGLAPARYTEQRGRRMPSVTTFARGKVRHISFSRTPTVLSLPDGAQDRFSVMLQLASLVRGDPKRYAQPGATHEFYVADVDSGETWPIQYVGSDTLQTSNGYLETRHFTRLARHAGDKRKIDIWLAPELDWMPVRILQTEPNGTQFDLVFRRKAAS